MVNASYIFLESASVLSLLNSPSTYEKSVSIFKVNLLKQDIQYIEEILGDMKEII